MVRIMSFAPIASQGVQKSRSPERRLTNDLNLLSEDSTGIGTLENLWIKVGPLGTVVLNLDPGNLLGDIIRGLVLASRVF